MGATTVTPAESVAPLERGDPGPLAWNDALLLGHQRMDGVHEEFVVLLGRVQAADDAEILGLFEELAVHTREHFELENQWMRETNFPPRECHMDEHAAVLHSIEQVRAAAALGDLEEVRRLAAALAGWFPGHADYLDSALAAWLCHRRHGGIPVVVRRGIELR